MFLAVGTVRANRSVRSAVWERSPLVEEIMMEKLLVPMTGHNPIETLMPCLEMLARPGMTVIFLFHYPVDSASYFRDHRITVESTRHATALGRAVADRYNWEAQKDRARQMIAPAMKALEARRVGVEVHLCSGRWAKAIKQYRLDKDVRWIVSQFSRSGLMGYWSAKTMVPSGWSSHLLSGDAGFFENKQQKHTRRRTGTLG
jgi:hypothetical protein